MQPREQDGDELEAPRRGEEREQASRRRGPQDRPGARREPDRVDRDREEGREEVTPGDVRPVPRARGEHEPDEHELGRERDNGLRVRQPRDEDAHQNETQRDRQCVRGARERDQRVLRAQPEHVVDQRRGADVRRADDAVCDRVGSSVGQQLLQRREVPPLVEPRGEHLARPTADREHEVDADPEQREDAVDRTDDACEPGRGGIGHGFVRHRLSVDTIPAAAHETRGRGAAAALLDLVPHPLPVHLRAGGVPQPIDSGRSVVP